VINLFTELISTILSKLLFLALHVEGNHIFPKPFSAAQERECFERLAQGDQNAKNELIEHNLRLVAHIAKKYYSITNDQDDLISIGTIGLIKAVDTFTYDKKVRFSTYGARCIENEILMHFRNLKKTASDVSINEPIESDKDGNTLTLMDVVSDDIDLIDNIDLKLKSEQLRKYIRSELTGREAQIISMRYGLNGSKPLTQREIAKLLDISRSYVSRIEKKALEKLKNRFVNG
jgi:RNA polymerase sporulation-specific sigma factor